MTDLLHVLLGAALVSIGVLVSAAADRIRQLRASQSNERTAVHESRPRARRVAPMPAPEDSTCSSDSAGSSDVVAALVAAGYKKAVAARAVAACSDRDQLTPESWTAAALRRCAGGAS